MKAATMSGKARNRSIKVYCTERIRNSSYSTVALLGFVAYILLLQTVRYIVVATVQYSGLCSIIRILISRKRREDEERRR